MRKIYWSTEDVPAEEFLRRLACWLSDPSGLNLSVRLDARAGVFRATISHLATPDDGVTTMLVRSFNCRHQEVADAQRKLSGPRERVPEVGHTPSGPLESELRGDDPSPQELDALAEEEALF